MTPVFDEVAPDGLSRAAAEIEDARLGRQQSPEPIEPGGLEQLVASRLGPGAAVTLIQPDDVVRVGCHAMFRVRHRPNFDSAHCAAPIATSTQCWMSPQR